MNNAVKINRAAVRAADRRRNTRRIGEPIVMRDALIAAAGLIRDECRKHSSTCAGCPIDDYCHQENGMLDSGPPCYWPDDKEVCG